MKNFKNVEINAGSMADIAFLLLIFFLVTTTMEKPEGIPRKLVVKQNGPSLELKNRNALEIHINKNGEILVDENQVAFSQLKNTLKDFIDNGAIDCDWCAGPKATNGSEHPSKAVVLLYSDYTTNYGEYIAIYNEVLTSYKELRNTLSTRLYGIDYTSLVNSYEKSNSEKVKEKMNTIETKYPQLLFEKTIDFAGK